MIQSLHLDFISSGSNIVYNTSTVQVIENQKTNIAQTIALDENKNELINSKPFLVSLNRIMVKCPGVKRVVYSQVAESISLA